MDTTIDLDKFNLLENKFNILKIPLTISRKRLKYLSVVTILL
jgi:hypothetical protein